MCSVVMDTEEGPLDYGLWDRTLMEVDLQLDSESFRRDFDYFSRGPFYDSDPLLPLIGNSEEDVCQLINALSKSSRDRNSCSDHCNLGNSDLDLVEGSHTSGSNEHSSNECLSPFLVPGIVIKTEPYDSQNLWMGQDFADSDNSSTTSGGSRRSNNQHNIKPFVLPPTPPSSDGDGESPSPQVLSSSRGGTSSLSIATAISTSLATAEDGSLMLTEEEKRTLIAEGYPIPSRLPLTKAEERSLKRIRRKIKNKISAQESRRKKKEYIESLEKKVKNLNEDNADLRRRLESSENANRSLAEQMSKYQTLLKGKVQVTPVRRAISVQAEKSS